MTTENQLTFAEFIDKHSYDISSVYVDKFWENISNKKWIYVDDQLIDWIGYQFNRSGKAKYINILKDNFNNGSDYKTYNYDQITNVFNSEDRDENDKEILEFKPVLTDIHNRTTHLIISPRCFKKSLMMIKTERANQIRDYYVDLEEIYLNYMQYQLQSKDQQIESLQDKYEKEYQFRIDHIAKSCTEYLYIASTKMYHSKNIFKIGKTRNIKERMQNYSTGYLDNEKLQIFKYIKVAHSQSLEKYIFEYLKPYQQEGKEMFKVEYKILDNLFNKIEAFEHHIVDSFNNIIKGELNDSELIPILETTTVSTNQMIEVKIEAPIRSQKMASTSAVDKLNEMGIELLSDFINPNANHRYRCMSIFQHEFECTYNNLMKYKDRGCKYCHKDSILDKVKIYRYNKDTLILDKVFNEWSDLQNNVEYSNGQSLMIKKNIRIGNWNNVCIGYIHTFIGPNEHNALDYNKQLHACEAKIIEVLELSNAVDKNPTYKAFHQDTGLRLFGLKKTNLAKQIKDTRLSTVNVDRHTITRCLANERIVDGFQIYV